MRMMDELKHMFLYASNKKVYAPINEKDRRKGSTILLLTPSLEESTKLMNLPYIYNPNLFTSFYVDRNVMAYIDNTGIENIDFDEAEEESISEAMVGRWGRKCKFKFDDKMSMVDERYILDVYNKKVVESLRRTLNFSTIPETITVTVHPTIDHLRKSAPKKILNIFKENIYSYTEDNNIHLLSKYVYDPERMAGPYENYIKAELIYCMISMYNTDLNPVTIKGIAYALSGSLDWVEENNNDIDRKSDIVWKFASTTKKLIARDGIREVQSYIRSADLRIYSSFVAKRTIGMISSLLFEAKLSYFERQRLLPSEFGIPEKRAYPMPDADHVRAAVRMFNNCDPDDEAQLAKAIIKKMEKFGITDIKVSAANRFSKYYKKPKDDKKKAKNESVLNEGIIASTNDITYNTASWRPGGKNILFVVGLSGGGKSTTARMISSDFDAVYIELDKFSLYDPSIPPREGRNDEKLIDMFAKANNFTRPMSEMSDTQYQAALIAFIDFLKAIADKDKNMMYVIEGVQLITYAEFGKAWIYSYPIIIKGTSVLRSISNRAKRRNDYKNYEMYNYEKRPENAFKVLSWYLSQEKGLKYLRKNAKKFNESTLLEEFNDNELHKSKVFFTKEITPESLVKIFEALGVEMGEKTAVKISTGEPGKGPRYCLDPDLIKDLVEHVNGTICECNVAYEGGRHTSEEHWKTIKAHGYYDIAPCDILDEDGEYSIPVEDGFVLKNVLGGTHMKNYDSFIVLSHFKGHAMGGYGGALKNVAIGLSSANGKKIVHSGGHITDAIAGMTPDGKMDSADKPIHDIFLRSMADANKAFGKEMGNKVVYINVANNISVDCDCDPEPSAPTMADIGIFASTDPVAVDQAAIDAVYNAPDSEPVRHRIEERHGLRTLDYAAHLGIGNRDYELIDIDDNIFYESTSFDTNDFITIPENKKADIRNITSTFSDRDNKYLGGDILDDHNIIYYNIEYVGNTPVGFILVHNKVAGPWGFVGIGVRNGYRGRGIARNLATKMLSELRDTGKCRGIVWNVVFGNTISENLAKSLGFTLFKKYKSYSEYDYIFDKNRTINESSVDEDEEYQDVLSICSNLSDDELKRITFYDTYKNSKYVIKRIIAYDNESNTPVGFLDVYRFPSKPEIAQIVIAVDGRYRGQGYAKYLVKELLDSNLKNTYGFNYYYWTAHTDNYYSQQLALNNGFIDTGILDKYGRKVFILNVKEVDTPFDEIPDYMRPTPNHEDYSITEGGSIIADNMAFINEADNNKYSEKLRRYLYKERIRNNKGVLEIYDKVRATNPQIKKMYLKLSMYKGLNLFVDLSYYHSLFLQNNMYKLDKAVNFYFDFLNRLINNSEIDSIYKKKTIFIPVDPGVWSVQPNSDVYDYKKNLNPISIIFRLIRTNPGGLKKAWGNKDIIFVGSRGYFKVDFNKFEMKNLPRFRTNLRKLMSMSEPIEDEYDIDELSADSKQEDDITATNTDSSKAMANKMIDRIENNTKIKIDDITATDAAPKNKMENDRRIASEEIVSSHLIMNKSSLNLNTDTADSKLGIAILAITPDDATEFDGFNGTPIKDLEDHLTLYCQP